ncbi:iron reductase domain protein [Stipitochalara longipes BDJ]|nr:iron reductase domain protein [Stipitochalara longipes BDJ]
MPKTRPLRSPFTILSLLLLLSGLSAAASSASASASSSPSTQFCTTSTKKDVNTDLCFAFASSHNETTGAKDLSLHLSALFPAPGTGWAGVGVGSAMSGSLMFVMYPSTSEEAVTFSIRTTNAHNAPVALSASSLAGKKGPDVHVTRKWVDEGGYSNVLVSCFGCDKWSGSTLDVRSVNQSWIWAWNEKQVMGSASEKVGLQKHGDKGLWVVLLDMSTSYIPSGPLPIAQVTDARISTPSKPKHHVHSFFSIVSIHGFILSSSFLALSLGLLAIRSGLAKAFKYHWVIQLAASVIIVIGCAMGIIVTFKHKSYFHTTHQWLGLFLGLGVVVQSWLGWRHHVIFVKIGRRTAVSNYHVWFGRTLVVLGNVNVAFGLKLSHGSRTKYMFWLSGVGLQLAVLIPMWYFWSRGKKIMDVVGAKEITGGAERGQYEDVGVEEEAFLVGEEDDIELDEEQRLHDTKEDLDME